ncbi:hypothetical protein H0X09_01795 [Candidatus Saccharibacteria bacterium]|nr:hypothetical protein [Candidatus Saccharibacteria bacterium]
MMSLTNRILILSLVLITGLTALAPLTQAQTDAGINLQISPLPIELNAKPGTKASADLRVRNAGTKSERIKAVIRAFDVQGDEGQVNFRNPRPDEQYVKWITFSKAEFEAPPGEWQTIKMNIDLPKEAAFGYYFAVQFQRATPVKPAPGTTGIEGAVAIFILLNAERPDASRKAEVTSFTANRKSYEFLPVDFKIGVKNTGNVHLAPSGNIFIRRGSKQVGVVELNQGGGNVLPSSSRRFSSSWSDGFPIYKDVVENGRTVTDEQGQPKRKLSWNLGDVQKLRFGHYTADLVLVYNDGQRDVPVTASVSFWVVPWRLLIGLLFVSIFVIIGLWSTFKKMSRTAKKLKGNK